MMLTTLTIVLTLFMLENQDVLPSADGRLPAKMPASYFLYINTYSGQQNRKGNKVSRKLFKYKIL
jgi:hypothetical protein